MTSLRVENLGTALSVSAYAGLGVRGDQVPQTGDQGSSILEPSVALPGEAATEFRFQILTGPTGGASFTELNEDGSATLTVPGDGTYTWTMNIWEDGVLTAESPVNGTVTVGAADTALAGTASLSLSADGDLSTAIALGGTATLALDGSGALSTQIRLAGTATLALVGAADLSTAMGLQATAALALDGSGDLTTQIRLAGTATLALTASGELAGTPTTALVGSASLAIDAAGDLTTQIRLAGAATLALSASGRLVGVGLGPVEDLAIVSITAQRAPASLTPRRETRAI